MKQITKIQIGAYTEINKPFTGYPVSVTVWNVNHDYTKEHRGQAVTTSLTGRERRSVSGYRATMVINLNNNRKDQTNLIRNLLNLTSTEFNRPFYPSNGSNATLTSIDGGAGTFGVSGALLVTGLYNNLSVVNKDKAGTARISNYNVDEFSVGTFTTPTDISTWANSDNVVVVATPDIPTLIGVSTDNTTSNISYYNIISDKIGIARELTVGNQMIQIELKGVDRIHEIPETIVI